MTDNYVPKAPWYRTREGLLCAGCFTMAALGILVWALHLTTVVIPRGGTLLWFNAGLFAAVITLLWTAATQYTPHKWE